MKRLAVIFLSLCFFLNIVAFHFIFYFRQQAIKQEMRMAIRMQTNTEAESDFVFSLDNKKGMSQLHWDGDDEFSYNGEMYDVIEKKIVNGTLTIRALADKKETSLLNKWHSKSDNNTRSNKVAYQLFQILQTLFHNSKSTEFACIKPSTDNFYYFSVTLPSPVKKIPTPPPQISA